MLVSQASNLPQREGIESERKRSSYKQLIILEPDPETSSGFSNRKRFEVRYVLINGCRKWQRLKLILELLMPDENNKKHLECIIARE